MATVKALGLEEHLKRAAPAPVYALVGADDALRSRSLRLLEALRRPGRAAGQQCAALRRCGRAARRLRRAAHAALLGMAARVVIEEGDAFLKSHADPLTGYVQKPNRSATLIICLIKLDMRTSVAKAIQSGGEIVDCATPTCGKRRTGCARARQAGVKLAPPTARALVEAVGPNLLALEGELQKLALYAEGGRAITAEDVAELVPQGRERSAFDLGAALARGDAASALRLCDELLLRGEAKEGLIALLARQVRQILAGQAARAPEGDRARDGPTDGDARLCGAPGIRGCGGSVGRLVRRPDRDARSGRLRVRRLRP